MGTVPTLSMPAEGSASSDTSHLLASLPEKCSLRVRCCNCFIEDDSILMRLGAELGASLVPHVIVVPAAHEHGTQCLQLGRST